MHSRHYRPPERSHEVWMWLLYLGLCVCYLGYIAWIVFF